MPGFRTFGFFVPSLALLWAPVPARALPIQPDG
jgi:hypothetical protein